MKTKEIIALASARIQQNTDAALEQLKTLRAERVAEALGRARRWQEDALLTLQANRQEHLREIEERRQAAANQPPDFRAQTEAFLRLEEQTVLDIFDASVKSVRDTYQRLVQQLK